MHLKEDLLNSIHKVQSGEGEVLQSTNKTLESSRISHRSTHIYRQLRLCVNRSGTRLAFSHPSPLHDIKGILSLVKEKATQEMVKLAKILHSELLLQRGENVLK
jgi:hypothetical protein